MDLLLLGVSHHTSPVSLRERVDFSKRGIAEALHELEGYPSATEAVVLTTCNRAEVYVACADKEATQTDLSRFMSEFHGVPAAELNPHLYSHSGAEVARHLCRVTSGLDSLVVGEPQIFGQVKEAYATASLERATGILLNKLFPWSFTVAKRVRTETNLGEGAVSVSYAAITLAKKIFGDLKNLSVLVIGAGEMAELTATHLQSHQVERIAVTSRTLDRATRLAQKVGGTAIDWTALEEELLQTDVVVTATGSSSPIITAGMIGHVMQARRNRPLFVIDVGLPRDVDSAAGDLEQVFLYNIDDLEAIVSENLARRQEQTSRAEAMISDAVRDFLAWLHSRGALPTLVALRRHFEAVRQSELKRLEPKLSRLPQEAQDRVDEVTRLLIQKLLHTPTEQLKTIADQVSATHYAEAITQVFRLDDDNDASSSESKTSAAHTEDKTPVTS